MRSNTRVWLRETIMTTEKELLYKSLLLGDSCVGKTCILSRYIDDTFLTSFTATVGLDIKCKTLEIDGQKIKMQIWDTAGQERFRTITRSYYRGANGVILVFDITNQKSFDNIAHWMEEINMNSSRSEIQIILVGNKCDLKSKRVISYSKAEEKAKEYELKYIETSAKTNYNIDEIFDELAKQIVKQNNHAIMPQQTPQEQTHKSKCSC